MLQVSVQQLSVFGIPLRKHAYRMCRCTHVVESLRSAGILVLHLVIIVILMQDEGVIGQGALVVHGTQTSIDLLLTLRANRNLVDVIFLLVVEEIFDDLLVLLIVIIVPD